jgi:predicted dehydrogenase
MPAGRQVRWALAGFGAGGRIFHAPLISTPPEMDLVAVVTRDPERRAQVAQLYPGAVCVDRIDDLPAVGVDGVTITTPPSTHADLALAALDAGLNVVVDKPFALNAADVATVIERAASVGRLLSVYQNRRWDGDFLTVKELLAQDRFGPVHRFISRMDRFRPVKSGWAGGTWQQGGGILLDLGPHMVDQAVQLFGPIRWVHAELATVREGAVADDDMEVHLRHESDVRTTLVAGYASAAAGRRFLINGLRGGFRVSWSDPQETMLKAGGSPRTVGANWGVANGVVGQLVDGSGVITRIPLERGRWDRFYQLMGAAVLGEGPVPVDPLDALHTAHVLDAARESAVHEQVVEVPPVPPRVAT